MPTNAALKEAIAELSAKLNEPAATVEGLTNAQLVTLKKDLSVKVEGLEPAGSPAIPAVTAASTEETEETEAPAKEQKKPTKLAVTPPGKKAKAAKKAKAKLPPYTVAPRCSFICGRRTKSEGEEVTVSDFPGGQKALDSLVEKGKVIKN